MPCPSRSPGFTLFELVITIGVVAILAAIAIPSFRYVTVASRIASEANSLLGSLGNARSLAAQEGRKVTICASTDGAACNGGTGSWQVGWIVFSDYNGNGIVDAGEPVRSAQKAFNSTDTLTPNPALNAITFNREGFAIGLASSNTFALRDATANAAWTRCIAVNLVGTAATQSAGTGNCT